MNLNLNKKKMKKKAERGKSRRFGKKSNKVSRFDRKQEKVQRTVPIRKRVMTPFPTNYLPTIRLKLSSIIRYNQFKAEIKKAEKEQRKERDLEVSMYSILTKYLEEEIDAQRNNIIQNGGGNKVMVFQISPKFEPVLGKTIKYLSTPDTVKIIPINKNYEKLTDKPLPYLIVVEINS